jgi:hypothetical protein
MASTASSRTFESSTFAALRTTASVTPRWSATTWRFEPAFPLSVGFGLVLCPPFLPTHSPSPGAPTVVLPTLLPPASRASVASTSNPIHSPSPWGASPRGCAALQDEDDASEGRAIVDTRSAALWFGWLFGQQRLDRIPQFVRYQFFAHINERNICS